MAMSKRDLTALSQAARVLWLYGHKTVASAVEDVWNAERLKDCVYGTPGCTDAKPHTLCEM